MEDTPVSPVAPVGPETTEPVDPVRRVEPSASELEAERAAAAAVESAADEAEVQVGTRAQRAQLEHPIVTPPATNVVADVHDAAEHGSPIAAAIERAQSADPTDRAQQLGGAAASAASGQASQLPEPTPRDELGLETDPSVDPLGPVDRTSSARDEHDTE